MYDNDDLERSPPTLVLVPGAVFNEIVETKIMVLLVLRTREL